MTRAKRIAAAAELLRGLSLTGDEVAALLAEPRVPPAWRPCRPERIALAREAIRTHYPAVRVCSLAHGEDYYGQATSRTRILIAPHMPESTTLDTLAHELAHAVCWDWQGEDQHHGPHWGVAYAEAYALIHEDHT